MLVLFPRLSPPPFPCSSLHQTLLLTILNARNPLAGTQG